MCDGLVREESKGGDMSVKNGLNGWNSVVKMGVVDDCFFVWGDFERKFWNVYDIVCGWLFS